MTVDVFARLLCAYHPDLLREPEVVPSDPIGDRRRLALVWNAFRTLEQLPPPFWLRRLIARLCGLSGEVTFAPHSVAVHCWHELPLAPSAMLRRGKRRPVPVHVLVDTEDVVLAFWAPAMSQLAAVTADTAEAGLLELAEATSWHAGTRHAYAGVILPVEADESTWLPRVQRRELTVLRALRDSGARVANLRGCGVLTWPEIEAVLVEASAETAIPEVQRAMATRTARWMLRAFSTPLTIS